MTYDSTNTDDEVSWSFGLGCNGRVEVLQERLALERTATHPLDFLQTRLERRQGGVMATVFRVGRTAPGRVGQRLLLDEEGVRTDVTEAGLREKLRADAEGAFGGGRTAVHRYGSGEGAVDALVEVVRPPRPTRHFRQRTGRRAAGASRGRARLPRHAGGQPPLGRPARRFPRRGRHLQRHAGDGPAQGFAARPTPRRW